MAVLDFVHYGSALSLRSYARCGSSMSVLDFVHLGSSLSLRQFARLGSTIALFGASRTRVPTLANAKRDPREHETRVPIINHAPPSRVESTNASIHSRIDSCIHSLHAHTHKKKSRIRPRVYSYTSAKPKTEIINLI